LIIGDANGSGRFRRPTISTFFPSLFGQHHSTPVIVPTKTTSKTRYLFRHEFEAFSFSGVSAVRPP
jgi:hypothetical protein